MSRPQPYGTTFQPTPQRRRGTLFFFFVSVRELKFSPSSFVTALAVAWAERVIFLTVLGIVFDYSHPCSATIRFDRKPTTRFSANFISVVFGSSRPKNDHALFCEFQVVRIKRKTTTRLSANFMSVEANEKQPRAYLQISCL